MIKAMVIVSAIAILLAICLIVFLIETNAVPERKTVMRGHGLTVADGRLPSRLNRSLEAAKRPANSPATGISPARSGVRHRDSGRSIRQTAAGSSPPVAAFTNVPRLGNQFHPREHRAVLIASNSGACWLNPGVRPITGAGQNENRRRGTFPPNISGIHTQMRHRRMAEVERVTATGPVVVITILSDQ